ncbi:hypothetical protein PL491_14825, partial [Phocaeicola vulgatus]|nr:hypothetical protein [Phocaeicola vulgatus]MDB0790591.1 hypothetical protein [Phocaeicola vulgatus]MDB0794551.1 hypothetical protein [Phocaeicola vulgatus]
ICGFFFRRVPTGARLKGDTLKLEVYSIGLSYTISMVVCRLSKFIIVKPFYKEKQIIRKGILHAVSPKEETAW